MNGLSGAFSGSNVMITGGLGFIGSNLAHELVRLNSNVLIVDSLLPGCGGNRYNIRDIEGRVRVEGADIRDWPKMCRLVRNQDFIFHLAAHLSHVNSMKDPALDFEINCMGSLNLLEACRRHSPDARLVYTGTRGQYGKMQYSPVNENHPIRPADINGVNKHAAEQYHVLYSRLYGLRTTSLRLTNVYGPRHQMRHSRQGFAGWFIRLAMDNQRIRIFGDGRQLRDLNYVDDVVSALLVAASEEKSNGETFNIGSGEPVSILEFAKTLIETSGSGSYELVPFPEDKKSIEVGSYVADFTKIKNRLGWEPKTPLRAGLEKTIRFYREHRRHYW